MDNLTTGVPNVTNADGTPDLHNNQITPSSVTANVWETPDIGKSYADFALAEWYTNLNRLLISSIEPKPSQTVLDIGCGTGSLTRLLAEKVRNYSPDCGIVGVDYSVEMVSYAQATSSQYSYVTYFQSVAEQIADNESIPPADFIISANALHLFQNLDKFLGGAHEKLRSHGTLAVSSLFTDAALDRESLPPWIRLLKSIRREAKERFPAESEGFKLQSESKTISLKLLSSKLEESGFKDVTCELTAVTIPYDSALSFMLIPGIREQFLPSSVDDISCKQIFDKALQNCANEYPEGLPRFSALIKATKSS